MLTETMLCKKCNETKPLALMRKKGKGAYEHTCNVCATARKRDLRAKASAFSQAVALEPPKVVSYAPKYVVTPYVPQTIWVRNGGLKHIKSVGFPC